MNRQHLAAAVLLAIPAATSLPAMHNTEVPEGKDSSLQFCFFYGCSWYEQWEYYLACALTGADNIFCESLAIS